jgi:hypothetical protein
MAQEFKNMDYIKESINFVKGNLIPCAVAGIGSGIPVIGGSVLVNYLRKKKEAGSSGAALKIGDLFNFENLVGNFLASLSMFGFSCCFVPGCLLIFTMPIMADKPGTEWLNAIKASFNFGKANLVPMIIMTIMCMLVAMLPVIPLIIIMVVLGMILPGILMLILNLVVLLLMLGWMSIAMPIVWGAIFNAYNDAKAGVAAAAAEAGVTLA